MSNLAAKTKLATAQYFPLREMGRRFGLLEVIVGRFADKNNRNRIVGAAVISVKQEQYELRQEHGRS